MKLMTAGLEKQFSKMESQDDSKDPMIVAKFFNSWCSQTWLAAAYIPEERIFFGYVSLFQDYCDEWGYFSLADLESIKTIERDLYFKPRPFSQAWDTVKHCERR